MDKFIGMLFFYTVVFYNKDSKYEKSWGSLWKYINEKSLRYLGKEMSRSDWELLKIKFKDYPEPSGECDASILENKHLVGMFEIFHEVLGETHYELCMYGIDEESEKDIKGQFYNEFHKFVSILGSSNGVSIVLGHWLGKSRYDLKMIDRMVKINSLIESE